MGGDKAFRALLVVVLLAVAVGEQEVQGPVHHVVGGHRRWDPTSDISSWLSGRVFRVGDKIWFTYSAPQESVVELQSLEEFQSCDLSNPIKMYTDGVDQIPLEREGNRYFVIGNQENCSNGLKLHVDVKPLETQQLPNQWSQPPPFQPPPPAEPKPEPFPVPVPEPDTPSGSTQLNGLSFGLFVGFLPCFLGLLMGL
ncbi:mavicyanin-like [Olea europaea var. sylvestris]|uniref:Mavicyanin-like isoform X1 n=1 Tax=Olea europaea subsp. europaea TaxID=158383 RepID=A0A8S0UU82_OLEEU|nr:mavicyanin-like [Olea europaea var. sylvestris]CAA3023951.1 mavicyanin-like isoform X1 [Olea europaea subsp. europaea]